MRRMAVLAAALLGSLAVVCGSPQGTARGQDGGPVEPRPPKPPSAPLADRIGAAIDRGVPWLKSRQVANGTWGRAGGDVNYSGNDDVYRWNAGLTAFALYTLLKCDVPADDPCIERGFAAVRKIGIDARSSYEQAATILALEAKYDPVKRESRREHAAAQRTAPGRRPNLRVKLGPKDAEWMRDLVDALEDRFNEGGWRYFTPNETKTMPGAPRDQSATAMAMLALLAAHRCGVEARRRTVTDAVAWTLAQQETHGPVVGGDGGGKGGGAVPAKPGDTRAAAPAVQARGWPYVRGSRVPGESPDVTGNMTTAGMVSLLAAQHILEDTAPESARALAPKIERAVADGSAWLGSRWTLKENPGSPYYTLMYLYGIERVGDLRRVPTIAGHDWYTEGAERLVAIQQRGGEWNTGTTHPPGDVLDTCFALLFLDRASFVAAVTPK